MKIVDEIPSVKLHTGRYYLFMCDCGVIFRSKWGNIKLKVVKSCGCKRTTANNRTKIPEYKTWNHMLDRCYNPKIERYPNYGGRGISVCQEWRDSFEAFYNSVGPRPSKSHSIDRINNDGNYEPSNCRWATKSEQSFNRRKYTHKKCV